MSTLAVNTITDSAGGSTAKINGLTPTASNMAGRNRIINGACQVAQRGTTAFNTQGVFVYGAVDRFVSAASGATTWSGSLTQADLGDGAKGHSVGFSSTGTAGIQIGQRVESFNTFDLVGGSAVFSGMLFQNTSSSQTFTIRVRYPSADNTFGNGLETTISDTTVSVPSGVSTPFQLAFTAPTQASRGLLVEVVSLISGTQTSRAVITWNWQLESGSVATPFERRPYGQELVLCQRYFQRHTSANGAIFRGSGATTGAHTAWMPFQVTMRATPTMSIGTPNYSNASGAAWQNMAQDGAEIGFTMSATSGYVFVPWTAGVEL
jgi:hypothetical protein